MKKLSASNSLLLVKHRYTLTRNFSVCLFIRIVIGDGTQPRSHDITDEPTGDHDSSNIHPSETDEASEIDEASETDEVTGSDGNHSLVDILAINTTVYITGDLHIAEDLLTQEIDIGGNTHNSYGNRSVSIAIQPSLLGYISKGIAPCGNKQLWDAMEAFELAFIFSDRDPITVSLLLLIKAVALFDASHRNEAMRRVQDLTTAYQHSDTCRVVNSYLCVQLAILAFEDGQYIEDDRLNDSITDITDLFSRRALFEPRLKIFTPLFGWDLNSLWQTINQRRWDGCDAAKDSDLEWSTGGCFGVVDNLNIDFWGTNSIPAGAAHSADIFARGAYEDDAQSVDEDDAQSAYESAPKSPVDDPPPGEKEPDGLDFQSRALRLIVRLGQPFGAAVEWGVQEGRFGSQHHRTGQGHSFCW
ncbi:hypothetical protein DFH29DRAFT_1037150 [Suillus ampliporus]|nr:hypothetical protein DFH29DRAFT_1037150 [Suillus ampliporus]